ncbi:MAG: nitronate monooxygenase, partial [Acetobacter sp.]|nr:nitronate monooxygenase [Acetobacter sp.]
MKALNTLTMSGAEVLPLVEGGKGISISTGVSAGAWAAAGGVGTVSLVNADSYDDQGDLVPQIY